MTCRHDLQRRTTNAAEAGFILIAVLWIVAALATLASIYSLYATNTAAASHLADDRLQAEAAIRAGVELAAFQVLAEPEASRPTHGAFTAKVGPAKLNVRYTSEVGRVDLNAAPKELLTGLFTSVGVSGDRAATYADRIIGWRKKAEPNVATDTGAKEVSAYKSAGLPYAPRQAPFTNSLELALVMGLPAQVVERILPDVTVFSGKAEIDVGSAEPEVIAALPGMTPDILLTVLKARAGDPKNGAALLNLLGAAHDRATLDAGKATRASITVDLDQGRRVQAVVVFVLADNGEEPFDIVYWRDDFDGPLGAE